MLELEAIWDGTPGQTARPGQFQLFDFLASEASQQSAKYLHLAGS